MRFHRPKEQTLTSDYGLVQFSFLRSMKTFTFKKGHRCINKHLNKYTNTASSYILDVETQYTIFNIENIVKYNIRRHSLSGWSRNFLPFRSNWIHPFNNGVHVVQTFFFCLVFCRPLFVPLSFFFWSLHCLFFVEIWHPDLLFGTFFVEIMILLFGILKLLFSRQSSNPEQKKLIKKPELFSRLHSISVIIWMSDWVIVV
jgi:hypothetical protein